MKSLFTPKEVISVIDVSYRQLQYWDHSHFIGPTMRQGRRKTRLFTFKDLVLIETAVKLRQEGYSVQHLRAVIKNLKKLLESLTFALVDVTLLFRGDEILVFNGTVTTNLAPKEFILMSVKKLRENVNTQFPEEASVRANIA